MAIGWRHSDLTPLAGFNTGTMNHQVGDWISQEKHDAMKRVYEQLWNTEGPATAKSLTRVARAGYLPPMAWDDDSIDDPHHMPVLELDGGKREMNKATLFEEVEFLSRTGANRGEIAKRLGTTWNSLERRLDRFQRRDLIRLIPVGEAA